jgi:hypothetical protein
MVDLALMRGNIGRPGVGIFPVRGHSTVQGQRAVGITEKPGMVPAERIKSLFGIEVPQSKGVNTVEACEKIIDGSVRAMAKSIPVRVSPEPRNFADSWCPRHVARVRPSRPTSSTSRSEVNFLRSPDLERRTSCVRATYSPPVVAE